MLQTLFHIARILVLTFVCISCQISKKENNTTAKSNHIEVLNYNKTVKTIHVFVALCDNKFQGIIPVPKSIGNGQDPANNLYWGCGNGIKSYFKKSNHWKLIEIRKMNDVRLERIIFKHRFSNFYLIADAYNGMYIKNCTQDFLKSSCGELKDTVNVDNTTLGIAGYSSLISYIGHNGLMDFNIDYKPINTDSIKRNIIILACYSKHFFSPYLQKANVNPMLWTTNLMCPEAYTIHDAIQAYIDGENEEGIRNKGAKAYNRYQKCGEKAAKNLLVTGW